MVAVAGISLLPPGGAVEVVDRFILCVLGWVSREIIITKRGRAGIGLDSIFLLVHIFLRKRYYTTSYSSRTDIGNELLRCMLYLFDAVKLLYLITDQLLVCYCH
jgi:hypothetical protein